MSTNTRDCMRIKPKFYLKTEASIGNWMKKLTEIEAFRIFTSTNSIAIDA